MIKHFLKNFKFLIYFLCLLYFSKEVSISSIGATVMSETRVGELSPTSISSFDLPLLISLMSVLCSLTFTKQHLYFVYQQWNVVFFCKLLDIMVKIMNKKLWKIVFKKYMIADK